jgi:penicillin-binding protein 1B
VPAVRVAEITGYDKVARIARAAGVGANIKPTPSIALGAYEVTPLEMASAYSIFANAAHLVKPSLINRIRDPQSRPVFESHPQRQL